jgi:hypothetical protein
MNRDDIIRTIDWILDLCPEIQQWQAEIIAEYASNLVKNEREECAMECIKLAHNWTRLGTWGENNDFHECAAAIRARSQQ